MEQLSTLVENQYHTPGLYENILKQLGEQGVDLENVHRKHIAAVDEFHIRGAEVSRELAIEIGLNDLLVLDVGCGIGGPSRMLAADYDCQVTGIDLSHEFVRTATALSELVGLQDKTEFIQASALDLPFESGYFDVVWTQHVQMNISDKLMFYSEINRVLSDKGKLIYYDIFQKNGEDVNYPVPWANDASVSFLATIADMNQILQELGLKNVLSTDQTSRGAGFLVGLFEMLKKNGPPKIGLNVLMGSSTQEKLINILKGLNEEKIVLQSGIYEKQPSGNMSHWQREIKSSSLSHNAFHMDGRIMQIDDPFYNGQSQS
jgi:SAM-dependent methyltransferase